MKSEVIVEVQEYLRKNLRITVDEESYGFNGKHIVIRAKMGDEVLSEEYIDVKPDDG